MAIDAATQPADLSANDAVWPTLAALKPPPEICAPTTAVSADERARAPSGRHLQLGARAVGAAAAPGVPRVA